MNIVIEIDEFNKDYIFLQEPVKNNIIDDSKFIRLIYSNNIFSVNTVYILFNLQIMEFYLTICYSLELIYFRSVLVLNCINEIKKYKHNMIGIAAN